jgi:hypothetical protein
MLILLKNDPLTDSAQIIGIAPDFEAISTSLWLPSAAACSALFPCFKNDTSCRAAGDKNSLSRKAV